MFVRKEKIVCDKTKTQIKDIFKNNIYTHSPVLNSKHINSTTAEKLFLGEIRDEKIIIWEKVNKKRVIVPVFEITAVEDENGSTIYLKSTLPYYNKIMLKIWFLFVFAFCALNLCYIPFCENKLIYSVNFIFGVFSFFLTFYPLKRLFSKRARNLILKIKEMLKKCL